MAETALNLTVTENIKSGKQVSSDAQVEGQDTLMLSLDSVEWFSKPGVTVTAVMEQWDGVTLGKDGQPVWTLLMSFTTESGPNEGPDGKPHLPSMSYMQPGLKAQPRRVRVTLEPSEAISLGAKAVSADSAKAVPVVNGKGVL